MGYLREGLALCFDRLPNTLRALEALVHAHHLLGVVLSRNMSAASRHETGHFVVARPDSQHMPHAVMKQPMASHPSEFFGTPLGRNPVE